MRADRPSGTVTFLLTDIEGSTRLLDELGADAYAEALAEHRRVLRAAFTGHGGVEVDTQGDAFFVAFPTADGALAAAAEAQAALSDGPIRVRMGLHTGTPLLTAEGYVGPDVHRAARIAGAGHGGQVLVSSSTAALLRPSGLRDLGEHRLKDLSAPERIYQAGDSQFPPLKTLYQTNLPVPPTSFLGRGRELAELTPLIARDDVRLVTLTGPGGTGKTRLALQTAATVADSFPDGVWWVPLTPLRDPALVLATAAGVLGASGDLAEHIADRRLLLLFDNFEQVVQAAADVGGLLARCPHLHAIVTSREPLHLAGEHEYPVDPLREIEAVELFLARARAVRPDLAAHDEVIRAIVARVDELPLAIELAAARAKALSLDEMLTRLDQRLPLLASGTRDAPGRQRTLSGAIEWSFELLASDEQRLFARLAVFSGGWTLASAEAVTDADIETVSSLVDKSLLRFRDDRYSMLATIREYALQRLAAEDAAGELRRKHALHFLAMAEQAARPDGVAGGDLARFESLDAEVNNFRTALAWAEERGAWDVALRLSAALGRFWAIRGAYAEGLRWTSVSLAASVETEPGIRLRALLSASVLAMKVSELLDSRRYAEEALSVAAAAGDQVGRAQALMYLSFLAAFCGDTDQRDVYAGEGLAIAREAGADSFAARLLMSRSIDALEDGDLEGAEDFIRESTALSERAQDEHLATQAAVQLAAITLHAGRPADAVALYRDCLRRAARLRFPEPITYSLGGLAAGYAALGQPGRAARLLGAHDRLAEDRHLYLERFHRDLLDRGYEWLRQQLAEDAVATARESGRTLTIDDAIALALEEDA